MYLSKFRITTLKETPADAEISSHQLMLRAGLIRRLASGLYSWLPLGVRVLRKVENIVRDEMNKSGGLEVLMPTVQPAELWQESGRWEQYGHELLRFKIAMVVNSATALHTKKSLPIWPAENSAVTNNCQSIITRFKPNSATRFVLVLASCGRVNLL